MSKTIAFLRVSSNKQETDNQKFGVINLALKENLNVDKWIVNIISGFSDENNQKLWATVREMEHGDTLLLAEISRAGRESIGVMAVFDYCHKNGINVHLAKEGYKPDKSIDSKIKTFFYAIAAEVEGARISQRVKETYLRKKADAAIKGVKLVWGRKAGSKIGIKKLDGKSIVKSKLDKYKEEILERVQLGYNNERIATEFNATRKTVRVFIRENNLKKAA